MDNLPRFLDAVGYKVPLSPTDYAVYFEYAHLRDIWSSLGGVTPGKSDINEANERKRRAITEVLELTAHDYLTSCSIKEFNAHFGAVPKPSAWCVQSPSTWSLPLYVGSFPDPLELLRVTKFKWAFNAKPDIVIHADADHALCIEAKLESGEGSYPVNAAEKAIFKERGLPRVGQTELQRYLMSDLLGIDTEFVFLLPKVTTHLTDHRMVTWSTAFGALDMEGQLGFVQDWVRGQVAPPRSVIPGGRSRKTATPDFRARVAALEERFQTGYAFLTGLADGRFAGFALGTVVNAHLYYQGDFYIYIKPGGDSIELLPTFNHRLWEGAADNHHLLFGGPISGLVTDLDGFNAGWASAQGDGITLTGGVPRLFFDRLLDLIRRVHE